MRKAFKLQDLDCANCAAKMENAIKGIDGVKSATVSFMTQKLVIEADDDCFDAVLDEAQRACSKIEPDCVILR
ncbi:MAG: cation transporter [Gordonibacter pamelaeae]|uniref:Cation transport ATPase n=3 Tax=Gordonibacter TaxID=644652 RepID=D6E6V9_9ACTN|nr:MULTISPECIES: cation transporter [Gordonibacter]MBS6974842.1 cation transporter [Eggerthellaceae bacterium]MBS4894449.1 cation transporter [Gordonibacter pamelaeae]MCB6311887.1 cation transporter [Gordonibacter pamelaeae]MCB6563010.1 cation transporter [Gordonibacter urolithinfaciens]MSA95543.1 heavy-metal-associated domain-containing protein [Gordonibacter urolithinfaciens]